MLESGHDVLARRQRAREQRQPAAPDNPWVQWQDMVSDAIIAALDGYRDQRDSQLEKIFLAIYDSPVLQAMVGTGATDEPRPRPGLAPAPQDVTGQKDE